MKEVEKKSEDYFENQKKEETQKVREIAEKIILVMKKQPEFLTHSFGNGQLTVENFVNQSCNHLFDSFPERFEITKDEGHFVRSFIHNNNEKIWEEVFGDLFYKYSRTLIRVERYDESNLYVIIPGWSLTEEITIPLLQVPENINYKIPNFGGIFFRCTAEVNIEVKNKKDLLFSRWHNYNL